MGCLRMERISSSARERVRTHVGAQLTLRYCFETPHTLQCCLVYLHTAIYYPQRYLSSIQHYRKSQCFENQRNQKRTQYTAVRPDLSASSISASEIWSNRRKLHSGGYPDCSSPQPRSLASCIWLTLVRHSTRTKSCTIASSTLQQPVRHIRNQTARARVTSH